MQCRLPTDDDTNRLFDSAFARLADSVYYSSDEASELIHEYYTKFRDPQYCKEIGVPVQNDDFFFHEDAGGMALRIHYYLGLKGDPNPICFIEWRAEYNKKRAEAHRIVREA